MHFPLVWFPAKMGNLMTSGHKRGVRVTWHSFDFFHSPHGLVGSHSHMATQLCSAATKTALTQVDTLAKNPFGALLRYHFAKSFLDAFVWVSQVPGEMETNDTAKNDKKWDFDEFSDYKFLWRVRIHENTTGFTSMTAAKSQTIASHQRHIWRRCPRDSASLSRFFRITFLTRKKRQLFDPCSDW